MNFNISGQSNPLSPLYCAEKSKPVNREKVKLYNFAESRVLSIYLFSRNVFFRLHLELCHNHLTAKWTGLERFTALLVAAYVTAREKSHVRLVVETDAAARAGVHLGGQKLGITLIDVAIDQGTSDCHFQRCALLALIQCAKP
jgi:hypothetical protein